MSTKPLIDLRRVHKVPKAYKDIVSGYVNQIQHDLPPNNSYYNISSLLKHLIILYYYASIKSKLLNREEIDKLLDLLHENKKDIANYAWNLIYESGTHGFRRKKFVTMIYSKPNILLLIKIKDGTIIGGYTKKGWDKKKYQFSDYTADKDAFVFYLQSPDGHKPFISNIKQDDASIKKALGYWTYSYANFGHQWIFYIKSTTHSHGLHQQDHHSITNYANYEPFKHDGKFLAGSNSKSSYDGDQFDFEVFQIDDSYNY